MEKQKLVAQVILGLVGLAIFIFGGYRFFTLEMNLQTVVHAILLCVTGLWTVAMALIAWHVPTMFLSLVGTAIGIGFATIPLFFFTGLTGWKLLWWVSWAIGGAFLFFMMIGFVKEMEEKLDPERFKKADEEDEGDDNDIKK